MNLKKAKALRKEARATLGTEVLDVIRQFHETLRQQRVQIENLEMAVRDIERQLSEGDDFEVEVEVPTGG
jgi:transcriptional regulator NrdR family protein